MQSQCYLGIVLYSAVSTSILADKPQKSSRVKELLEKYITGEMLGWIPLAGNEFKLQFLSVVVTCIVAQALPSGHGEVASTTIVSIKLDDEVPSTAMERALAAAEKHGAAATSATKRALQQESSRGLDAVGGYNDTIRQLKELVLLPMTNASLFASVGLQLPRGVLLYGPPGSFAALLEQRTNTFQLLVFSSSIASPNFQARANPCWPDPWHMRPKPLCLSSTGLKRCLSTWVNLRAPLPAYLLRHERWLHR